MKKMAILIILSLVALVSCDVLARIFAPSIQVQLDAQSPSVSSSIAGSRALATGISVTLNMGVDGSQGGALVGGHSDVADLTMSFRLDTILPDGMVVGGTKGISETFTAPDPSIIDLSIPDGTLLDPVSGFFMARFSETRQTVIIATHDEWPGPKLDEVDEVVMRLGDNNQQWMETSNGVTYYDALRMGPHFVIEQTDGTTQTYPSDTNTVLLDGNPVELTFDYVLFVPSSKTAAGFSAYVPTGRTVSNPVLGDEMAGDPQGESWYVNEPSTWTLKPEWIEDDYGNEGLFAVIDDIAGVSDPLQRRTDEHWVALAEYFQQFFAKFYMAGSTMFNVPNQETGVGGLGNGGESGFVMMALDDSNGPLDLRGDAVISVVYQPDPSDFTVEGDALDLVGDPPLKFRAVAVNASP